MKKIIVLSVFLMSSIMLLAQEGVEKSQIKINFLIPSISYEKSLSTKNTLYSEFGTSFGYSSSFSQTNWTFTPFINEEFRHYYNLDKRLSKGKRIKNNSGSFFALSAIYNFESLNTNSNFISQNADISIIPNWGFQHISKSGFSIGLNLGCGYSFNKNDNQFVTMTKLSLGWKLR
jgi:long-subunit fatty acid transport protein